ncbi:MAG: hypothetical protein U9Q22_02810 [Candidatus Altiarchaeota archaeon]|nr:hypothetical protein [Candidatus Altiarchaeota archaeon]
MGVDSSKSGEESKSEEEYVKGFTEVLGRIKEKSRNRHLYRRKVEEGDSFKLKTSHSRMIGEVSVLEDLYKAIQEAPCEAIVFHMERCNDFAEWISYAVGDWCLGCEMRDVEGADPEEARAEMLKILSERINRLKLI